jgi:adenosylcobyric acid synthase
VKGGLLVCGTASDAGKSFVVAGLCRSLARRGVRVAPFKAQNMALNAAVTPDGSEIGHAQWVQALAAGAEPEAAMNPVLLKPTGERTSQVIVMGKPAGMLTTEQYHETKDDLVLTVLDALADLRSRYDVVICEGAGNPAEINLLAHDVVNLPLADAAGLPAIIVGDIDRGGVFASLYGTVALLPEHLRRHVNGFVVNKLRGDPALLDGAFADLEARCGVPTLGILPFMAGLDLDAEDSLALDRPDPEVDPHATGSDVLDVAAIRFPRVSNASDLDPLRAEPNVRVRWVRSTADLGKPDLVVLPGSKATRDDLAWFRQTGLAVAVECTDTTVLGVCAGLQMIGEVIDDPEGVEGDPGVERGLGWISVVTTFVDDKVLDRPEALAVAGPGASHRASGYRIHHGRVRGESEAPPWLVTDDGDTLGWQAGWVAGTTLHGVFEQDDFRSSVLQWVARRAGKSWEPGEVGFSAARQARLDGIADLIETHLDMDALETIIATGAP